MGKDDDDNLFEDLDSFFEPINEVGWPEESGSEVQDAPAAPSAAPEPPTEDEAPVDEPDVVEEQAAFGVMATQDEDENDESLDQDFAAAEWSEDDVPSGIEGDALTFEGESEPGLVVGVGADHNELITPRGPGSDEADDTAAPVVEPSGEPTVIQFDEVGLVGSEPGLGILTEDGIAADDEADDIIGGYLPEGERDIEREILADLAAPDPEEPTATLADGLSGPSWHEPSQPDVGGDAQVPSQPRNMPAAFVTGIALAAVALIALAWDSAIFAWIAGVAVLYAQYELYVALKKRHLETATLVGLIFGAFMLFAGYNYGVGGAAVFLALGFIFAILWEIATPAKFRKQVTINIGLTVLGMAYIPLLAAFGMEMLSRPGVQDVSPSGRVLLLLILGLTFAYDTVAFIAGSMFGEHQLAPSISPKKSIEGAVAGSFAVALIAVVVGGLADLSLPHSIMLAIVVMVGAPLGDLAESLIKRDLGIKDMGSILPGHGGVLDRIDSVLVVLPLAALVAMVL